jgi:hypothetical protein
MPEAILWKPLSQMLLDHDRITVTLPNSCSLLCYESNPEPHIF